VESLCTTLPEHILQHFADQTGARKMTTKDNRIHEGGVNVFADLELPDAENHFLKAQIVAELYPNPKYRGCSRATSANTPLTA
jgi:hypothetical protein